MEMRDTRKVVVTRPFVASKVGNDQLTINEGEFLSLIGDVIPDPNPNRIGSKSLILAENAKGERGYIPANGNRAHDIHAVDHYRIRCPEDIIYGHSEEVRGYDHYDYDVGDWLDVLDKESGIWISAMVVYRQDNWIEVHYEERPSRYDEQIDVVQEKYRLRSLTTKSRDKAVREMTDEVEQTGCGGTRNVPFVPPLKVVTSKDSVSSDNYLETHGHNTSSCGTDLGSVLMRINVLESQLEIARKASVVERKKMEFRWKAEQTEMIRKLGLQQEEIERLKLDNGKLKQDLAYWVKLLIHTANKMKALESQSIKIRTPDAQIERQRE